MYHRPTSAALSFRVLIFFCGLAAVTSSLRERQLSGDPLLGNWEKEEGLANFINAKIESSRTSSPTMPMPTNNPSKSPTRAPTDNPTTSPTTPPTLSPSDSPNQSPSAGPTEQPSISSQPSGQPSPPPSQPPSNSPSTSVMPTEAPSIKPSLKPSGSPSNSENPTSLPSSRPSPVSSMSPSSKPSAVLSGAPSLSPSGSPTHRPTQSSPPSQPPTEPNVIANSIIINRSKSRNSTPLLIIGACCFVVVASTSLYLCKRGSQLKRVEGRSAPSVIEVSTGRDSKHDVGIISPYSIEDGLIRAHCNFDVNYTDSESRASEEGTHDYHHAPKTKHFENLGDLEDIDLESSSDRIDAVPNSVSVIRQTPPPKATESDYCDLNDGKETPGHSKLRMPKSIYVPKIFQRTREGENDNRQVKTWNQIREEDRSPCSSGYAPASVPSPMLSPFFVKGLTSILSPNGGKGKRGVLMNDHCSDMSDDEGADKERKSKKAERRTKRSRVTKSPLKEIVVKREVPNFGIVDGQKKSPSEDSAKNCSGEQKSPKTLGSKSSEGSSIEWGIDVSKVQPSKASFEDNMAKLQDILVSIKSMGSREASQAEQCEVPMTYTDESSETNLKSEKETHCRADATTPKSDATEFDIRPIESTSPGDNGSDQTESMSVSSVNSTPPTSANENMPNITFGRELLNSGRMSEEGTFNFRNILNDPKNDLYECHAPSGPLGIVVDTTPLGPRVRSLNPLSPIFGTISPGDVIVGVDEVDTVGMEAGKFWKIVSRKANQQERILTILRI